MTSVDGTGTVPTETGGAGTGEGPDKGDGKGKGDGKADDQEQEQELVAMPPTTAVASPVAERILPLLLLVALIGGVVANLIRLRHVRRRQA